MKLYEFTTTTDDSGEKIVRAAGRVSDHLDPALQKEWITFQVAVDEPTVRNGAILRNIILQKVHESLLELSRDFEQIVRPRDP